MKIHLLQTGTVRCKQFQLTGASHNLSRMYQLIFTQKWGEWMPTYCWLIEHSNGLILVDTGETSKIYEPGYLPKGGLYHKAVETNIKKEEEIPNQLAQLGVKPNDIKTVVLTHMHGDHIGGLSHFEHCQILVSKKEYEMATSKKGTGNGYFPKNWPAWFTPTLIDYTGPAEGVFQKSYPLTTDGSIVAVPTPGHSAGHQSILVKDKSFTYLLAGDLTYNLDTLRQEIPDVVLMNKAAQETVSRVHQYAKAHPTVYLSSHDWNAAQLLQSKTTVY
ncbi:MAG: N-acyl homoserine lactonase family protein [Saprospiraceae bacterium]|nr:N-acyl homoserine lactonase family protein [Saprospiraceae bacterium]